MASGLNFFTQALLGDHGQQATADACERVKEAFENKKNPVLRFDAHGKSSPAIVGDLMDSSAILVVKVTSGTFENRSKKEHPTANMTKAQEEKGFKKLGLHKMLAVYTLYLKAEDARMRDLIATPEDCSHIIQPAHHPTLSIMSVQAIFEPHNVNMRRIACGVVGQYAACCVCCHGQDGVQECRFWPHVVPHMLVPVHAP